MTLAESCVHIRAMNCDISSMLDAWDYKPGEICVRRFKARDGVEKIQLRVDLGLLQMNAEGRPDGKRPCGCESWFEHHQNRLAKHCEANGGDSEGFSLTAEDCARLLQEAIQYHHRYICLFQLQDYEAVIRDTERNLEVFDFVDEFAPSDEVSWSLQQFRPQLLLMDTRARGSLALKQDDFAQAVELVTHGLEGLRAFYEEFERPDLAEQSGEVQSLEAWLAQLNDKKTACSPPPVLSERQKLEMALDDAIRAEDYEKAAQYRDTLRRMSTPGSI